MGPAKDGTSGSRLPSPVFVSFAIAYNTTQTPVTRLDSTPLEPLRLAVRARQLHCIVSNHVHVRRDTDEPLIPQILVRPALAIKAFSRYPSTSSRVEHFVPFAPFRRSIFTLCFYTCAPFPPATSRDTCRGHPPTTTAQPLAAHTIGPHRIQSTTSATAHRSHVASAQASCMTASRLCQASS